MSTSPRRGIVREFAEGVGFLGRGLRMYASSPGIMWKGIIPAVIVFGVYLTAIILLTLNIEPIAAWATPFTADLADGVRELVQLLVGIALLGLGLLLVVFTFTAVTLAVGDPFYEKIWNRTESLDGSAPPALDIGFWTGVSRTLGDTLRLLAITILVSVLVFLIGLIPVVGTVCGAVLGALFAGWFLTLELTGFAFEARGLRLRDRRHVMGVRRARTLGFGVATYLTFLVPILAVFVMPAAVAGATLLARDSLQAAALRQDSAASAST